MEIATNKELELFAKQIVPKGIEVGTLHLRKGVNLKDWFESNIGCYHLEVNELKGWR